MVRFRRSAVLLAVAFATAGCAGSSPQAPAPTDESTQSPSSPVSPSPSPSISIPPTPTVSPTEDLETLEDGRHFGYVKSADVEAGTVVFDLAEFFTGAEADAAAVEDGVIQEGEHVDNDYYIRNRNTRLRTLGLADDVTLMIVDWGGCCESVEGELEPWAASFEEPDPSGKYRGATSPWWLTFENGRITLIEEQYLP